MTEPEADECEQSVELQIGPESAGLSEREEPGGHREKHNTSKRDLHCNDCKEKPRQGTQRRTKRQTLSVAVTSI